MAPTGTDSALTLFMVIAFGLYFAWGIMQTVKRENPARRRVSRKYALETAVVLIVAMMTIALLNAWSYKTWQPLWVLGGISVIIVLSLIIYLPPD